MELEFDKEIDAILRKARSGIGVTAANTDHLDADAIAAFAENALPDKAKLLYVEHFADCDSCRKHLAFAMQMNKEAAIAASAPVAEPLIETSIPWYQSFFKTPNLALAMGALVLVFSGILSYLVIQKQNVSDSATVSQVTEPEQSRGGPNFGDESDGAIPTPTNEPAASSANAASNSAAANVAPATNAARIDSAGKPLDSAKSGQFQIDGASGSENNFIIDGQEVTGGAPLPKSAAKPAPPVTTDTTTSSVLKDRDEKKAVAVASKEESRDKKDLAKLKQNEDDRGMRRDAPPPAAKVGPSRAGPVQNQSNQINSNMPVTRVVGGKTFNNREGAWYDSAYHGQATLNVRRGTAEYKKLDNGLRKIADTLGGTVVIMWKAKAYRIQ